ncbi:copper resistance protein B [Thermocrinis sp.]
MKVLFLLFPILALAQEREFYPVEPMHPLRYGGIFVEKLEYRHKSKSLDFEVSSFYGGDYHKLWLELEGKRKLDVGKGKIERADLLLSKAISSFFDLRAGVGYAGGDEGGRSKAVFGFKGLAPYWLEVDGAINLTNKGELYGKLEVEYDLLLTQRLILQPSLEVLASTKDIEPLEIKKGLSKTTLALRLRYEIKREFAPYIGFSFEKHSGKGEEINFLFGLKFWF